MCAPLVMEEVAKQISRRALLGSGLGLLASRAVAQAQVQGKAFSRAVDTLSLDFGPSKEFKAHVTLLGAGKYGLENLANLAQVPPAGALIFVGAPKHRGASGGPVRAGAVW